MVDTFSYFAYGSKMWTGCCGERHQLLRWEPDTSKSISGKRPGMQGMAA